MTARALWTIAPERAVIRDEIIAAPGDDEVVVRALYSGLSRGTESLVFHGRVPASEAERMRCPHMGGAFPFPVKYGYCMVGLVEHGPAVLQGRTVFCLHPHQDRFVVEAAAVTPVPAAVPARRAVLAANMETALNGLWDAGAGPADRIVVVGAGVVGCLVARLAVRMPGTRVTLVDVDPAKAAVAAALGAAFAAPDAAPRGADVVVHTSATGRGLSTAIACAGDEATVLELSWFGEGEVPVALGAQFHAGRVRLVSSQVGRVAASRRPRWDYAQRLRAVFDLLDDPALDALMSPDVAFEALPERLPDILKPGSGVLCQTVAYGG